MKDNKLKFDTSCHVLYSKPCKKEILAKIALHYPAAEQEVVWEKVQRQYVAFLSDWRTDLGGKKNFHNGAGGTYDCIAIMSHVSFYKSIVDQDRTSVVICNLKHEIIYMNLAADTSYEKRGGDKLIGRSLLDCHNPEFHNIVYTFHNEKQNKDVYMVALRDEGKLIGYYD